MPHFYKYMSPETAKIVLRGRRLRWSTPSKLNDPFDMQFAFQVRNDFAAVKPRALDIKWDHYNGRLLDLPPNDIGRAMRLLRDRLPQMDRAAFNDHFGPVLDLCFERLVQRLDRYNEEIRTAVGNDKIFCLADRGDNILMWSHYAGNHTGIALRFRTETDDNPFRRARRVDYVDHMPSLYTDEALQHLLGGYRGLDPDQVMRTIVWTKSRHWKYEGEWRVYSGAGRSRDLVEDVPFNAHELDGVIFGARASDPDRVEISELAKPYPRIELLKAALSTGAFGVDLVPM